MPITAREIGRIIEGWAPASLLAAWDKSGFQAGDPNRTVQGILVTLDVSREVLTEAGRRGADMIVAHHPLIFRALADLRLDRPQGALLARVVESGLVIYCAHTNLDRARGGTDDLLAVALGLQDVEVLKPEGREEVFKLTVYVPQGHENSIREAMTAAGAGCLGNYSHCTFRVAGTGTFKPLPGTNPFLGEPGKETEVREMRIETIATARVLPRVLAAMLAVHPYEEVAYDVTRLEQPGKTIGFGRIGNLPEPCSLTDFIVQVKKGLGLQCLQVAGREEKIIERVALCGGSGGSLVETAIDRGAHVFVSGDIRYHEALAAVTADVAVIDAGHVGTERGLLPAVAAFLTRELAQRNITDVQVFCHQPQDVFRVI